jgi:transposase
MGASSASETGHASDHRPGHARWEPKTSWGPPQSFASSREPYRELIEQGLSRGRNAMTVWQDLVSDPSFAGSCQTVKRFVRKPRGPQCPEAVGIILAAAGEEAQVDYGSGACEF